MNEWLQRIIMGLPELPPSPFPKISPHSPLVNEALDSLPPRLRQHAEKFEVEDIGQRLIMKLANLYSKPVFGEDLANVVGLAQPGAPMKISPDVLMMDEKAGVPSRLTGLLAHEAAHYEQQSPYSSLTNYLRHVGETVTKPHAERSFEKEAFQVEDEIAKAADRKNFYRYFNQFKSQQFATSKRRQGEP